MKLETKLGIYLITLIISIIFGLFIMLYPFEYYSVVDKVTEDTSINILLIVLATKAVGILLLYLASEIYQKHFKTRYYEKI